MIYTFRPALWRRPFLGAGLATAAAALIPWRAARSKLARARPFHPSVNIVYDGNSLVGCANNGARDQYGYTATVLGDLLGVDVANVAVGGQTIQNMAGQVDQFNPQATASRVDGAWSPHAEVNMLVMQEGTNNIGRARRSGAESVRDLQSYVTARMARHPWSHLVVVSCLPRMAPDEQLTHTLCSETAAYNKLCAAAFTHYADACAADGPFGSIMRSSTRFTNAAFEPSVAAGYWSSPDSAGAGAHVHLSDKGYAYVAGVVAQTIRSALS